MISPISRTSSTETYWRPLQAVLLHLLAASKLVTPNERAAHACEVDAYLEREAISLDAGLSSSRAAELLAAAVERLAVKRLGDLELARLALVVLG